MEQRHVLADGPAHYQIQVSGPLDAHWSGWFRDLTITHDSAGNTLLAGWLLDQAALYGVISHIRDLGLTLLSVQQLPAPPDCPEPLLALYARSGRLRRR